MLVNALKGGECQLHAFLYTFIEKFGPPKFIKIVGSVINPPNLPIGSYELLSIMLGNDIEQGIKYYILVSDNKGQVYNIPLLPNTKVYTTAEIVIVNYTVLADTLNLKAQEDVFTIARDFMQKSNIKAGIVYSDDWLEVEHLHIRFANEFNFTYLEGIYKANFTGFMGLKRLHSHAIVKKQQAEAIQGGHIRNLHVLHDNSTVLFLPIPHLEFTSCKDSITRWQELEIIST